MALFTKTPKTGWIGSIRVFESSTGKSFRVEVTGRNVEERLSFPLTEKFWIPKENANNDPEIAATLGSLKAKKTKTRYQGTLIIDEWRKAVENKIIPKEIANLVQKEIDDKFEPVTFGYGLVDNKDKWMYAKKRLDELKNL